MFLFQYTYLILIKYLFFLSCIVIIMILLSLCFSKNKPTFEKLTAYECGYETFNDTKHPFDLRYYIIGLLFILFDLELMFLFPWITSLFLQGNTIFYIGLDFILELFLSFIFIWYLNILDWK